jgi:hypothetical protein
MRSHDIVSQCMRSQLSVVIYLSLIDCHLLMLHRALPHLVIYIIIVAILLSKYSPQPHITSQPHTMSDSAAATDTATTPAPAPEVKATQDDTVAVATPYKSRSVKQSVLSVEQSEGVGARVRRSIGRPELRNFDPFLMLDEFSVGM